MPETSGPAVGISIILELYDDVENLLANRAKVEQAAPVLKLLGLLDGDGIFSVFLSKSAAHKDMLVI